MKKFVSVILAVIIMLSFAAVPAAAYEGSVRDSAPESDSVTVISDENEADFSRKIVTGTDEDDADEDISYSDDVPATGDQNKYIIGVIVIAAALILIVIVIIRKKHE